MAARHLKDIVFVTVDGYWGKVQSVFNWNPYNHSTQIIHRACSIMSICESFATILRPLTHFTSEEQQFTGLRFIQLLEHETTHALWRFSRVFNTQLDPRRGLSEEWERFGMVQAHEIHEDEVDNRKDEAVCEDCVRVLCYSKPFFEDYSGAELGWISENHIWGGAFDRLLDIRCDETLAALLGYGLVFQQQKC